MSEKENLRARIQQCRRIIAFGIDDVTAERLRDFMAELEEELARQGSEIDARDDRGERPATS
jgi:hypothetical protein